MRTLPYLFAVVGILLGNPAAYGMATSRVGPDSAHKNSTVEQIDWPKGIVALPRHESRVYSVWVNGGENFYFKSDLKDINELIELFSQARMRDHEVALKKGHGNVNTFKKEKYGYNVNLWINAGISLGYTRDKQMEKARTHEPRLIIHLTEKEADLWLDKLVFPKNIILTSEFENLKSPRERPTRNNWFTEVQFGDGKPAVDFRGQRTDPRDLLGDAFRAGHLPWRCQLQGQIPRAIFRRRNETAQIRGCLAHDDRWHLVHHCQSRSSPVAAGRSVP